MSAIGYSLFQRFNTSSCLRTFIRGKRKDRRNPVASFENYEQAHEKEMKQKLLKDELRKKPEFQQFFRQNGEDIAKLERENYEKLQKEVNRVLYKHDPYLQGDEISPEALDDIRQNVDLLAVKLAAPENQLIDRMIKLADGDQRFGPAVQIAKSLRHRYEKKKILLEGKRLIMDALSSGVRVESIFVSSNTEIKNFNFDFTNLDYEIKFYQVSPKSVNLWSDVETSQGFIAIAKMPAPGDCKLKRTVDLPLHLLLDHVRDPGNMGTIIRSAAAIGVEKILISKASVDIWDPKVIRSAMGGHFRVPIIQDLSYDEMIGYLSDKTVVVFADNPKPNSTNADHLEYTQLGRLINTQRHAALVIGGETHGINQKMYAATSTKVKPQNQATVNIPLENGVESLNAGIAFTVIGYELKRLLSES